MYAFGFSLFTLYAFSDAPRRCEKDFSARHYIPDAAKKHLHSDCHACGTPMLFIYFLFMLFLYSAGVTL